MQAYHTTGPGQPLEPVECPRPAPDGNAVLLKILATGVCHSDVHLQDGGFDLGGGRSLAAGRPGLALGHEIAGEVVAAGPDARGIEPGQRYVVYPWIGCGDCMLCQRGREQLCDRGRALGVQAAGGFADYVLVPDARYLFALGDADAALSCTYACAGLTAYSALKKSGPPGPGGSLLVVGAGGVGQNAIRMARAIYGLSPIVADIDAARREALAREGIDVLLDPADPDATGKVLKRLGGVDAAIDFVGSEDSSRFAQRALRKGGVLVVVGLYGGTFSMPLPLIPMTERVIRGSYVGSLAEMAELMELARAGRIPPIPVERRARSAASATQALDDLRNGRAQGRIVLVPRAG